MAFPQDSVQPAEAPDAVSPEEQDLLTANVSVVSLYEPDDRVEDTRTALRGLVPGAVSLILGILALTLTSQVQVVKNTPLGPPFWPGMVSWAMIVLGVVLLVVYFVRGMRWGDVPDPMTGWGLSRLIISLGVLVGYLLLWSVLQFWASTLLTLLFLVALFGARGWKPLILFPVGITAVLHFLFVVALKVPL